MNEAALYETDRDDLLELLPTSISSALSVIPEDVVNMSESALLKKIPSDMMETVEVLRTSFWLEYNRSKVSGHNFNAAAVYASVCSKGFFMKKILTRSYMAALISRPPIGYEIAVQNLLIKSLRKQREILNLSAKDPQTGKINMGILNAQIKIAENTHNRVKGLPVTRTEVATFNLTKNVGGAPSLEKKSIEEMQKRVAELERLEGKVPAKVIDIEKE